MPAFQIVAWRAFVDAEQVDHAVVVFAQERIHLLVIPFLGDGRYRIDEKLGSGGLLGNFLALGAGLSFGCYYISLDQCPENERLSGIVIANLLTALVGVPFLFTTHPALSGAPLLYIVLLGVFQLGIPYALLAAGSEYCPPLACSLLGALEPLLNPVWVFLFDGEAPGPFALIGGAVVIATITVWCVYKDRKAKAEAAVQ